MNNSFKKNLLLLLVICLCAKQLLALYERPTIILNILVRIIPLLMLDYKSIKKIYVISAIYLIGIPFCMNGVFYFLPLLFSAYALRNINYIYIVKTFLIVFSFMIFCQAILIELGIGIVEERILIKGMNKVVTYDFGFGNPNTFSVIIFYIMCCFYLIYYKMNKLILFAILLLASIWLYSYAGSRTVFLSCIFLILSFILYPFPNLKKYVFSNIILSLLPMVVGATLLFANYFASDDELNQLLSGRIAITALLFESLNSPTQALFGQPITDDVVPIDNAILYILVRLGIIGVAFFLYKYIRIIKVKHTLSTPVISVLLIIIISGIGEASWMHMGYASSFFFWILLINRTIS